MAKNHQKRRAPPLVEPLEGRQLLSAAQINGAVYNDQNLNGIHDSGENGVADIQVFVDANGNGVLNDGESTTQTNADGNYSLPTATGGQVRVSAAGWSMLRPTSSVMAVPDGAYTLDIPIYESTTISGLIYQDQNRNGVRDEGEGGIANATVNGFNYSPVTVFPGFTAFDDGSHLWIPGPSCGAFCVLQVGGVILGPVRQVYTQTAEDGSFTLHDMPVSSLSVALDSTKFVRTAAPEADENQEIGVLPIPEHGFGVAEVHGRVFDDANNNGVFDPDEKLLSGVMITASEIPPAAASAVDFFTAGTTERGVIIIGGGGGQNANSSATSDTNGNFILQGLRQGNFTMRIFTSSYPVEAQPINFSLTALEVKTLDLPAHLYCNMSGRVLREGGSLDSGTRVYLDLNNNNKHDANELSTTTSQGFYYFNHVPPGPYTVRVIAKHTRILGQLPHGIASHDQVIENPDINVDQPFAQVPIRIYLDANSNGLKDLGEVFLRKGMIFVDRDGDGVVDKNESSRFITDKGVARLDLAFGKTPISFQTRPKSKYGLYSRSVKVNITDPSQPPRLLVGLRPQR